MSVEKPESPDTNEFKRVGRSLSDRAVGVVFKSVLTLAAIAEYGLRDGVKAVQSGEAIAGMIEGAIIAPKLAYVDQENGLLIYKEATKGGLIGYDVARPFEFPAQPNAEPIPTISEGVLWSMLPKELEENPASLRTPTGYVELYNYEHLLTLSKYPLETLIGEKVLAAVSLAEAFDTVGLGEHIGGLEARRIATDRVYQVTPKGNTLMRLEEDSGDKTPKLEPRFKTVLVPGLLAH